MSVKFVIGIGSQRAGSTLLYTILEQCTPIYMHPVKELHYFDTLYQVRNPGVLHKFSVNQLNRDIEKLMKAKDLSFVNNRYKNSLRANFLLATRKLQQIAYVDLFRPCLHGNEWLGEVTPEYMILPPEGIQHMRETLGEDAKILLLARNPVKRFVSAFKLLMHGRPDADKSLFEQDMLEILHNPGHQGWLTVQDALNDYETALVNYQSQFKSVLMLSYDELFGAVEQTAEKLSAFLGVKFDLSNYSQLVGTKINALDDTRDLSEQTLALLTARYQKQQAYLDAVFGSGYCAA